MPSSACVSASMRPAAALCGRFVSLHLRACFAAIGYRSFLGVVKTVYHIQHRALAGTVRADDRSNLALSNIKANAIERFDIAEMFTDMLY